MYFLQVLQYTPPTIMLRKLFVLAEVHEYPVAFALIPMHIMKCILIHV